MANRLEVIRLHRRKPEMTASELASELGCSPEYVRKTAKRNGLVLASPRKANNDPAMLRAEVRRLLWRARKLLQRARDLEESGL